MPSDRIDLTDLRLFVHVCTAGSITAGAALSHLTLASASQRVLGMEQVLGTPLLRRLPRGVTPTPAGHSLLQHARAVLLQMERLQADMGAFGAGLRGQVRLLCNTSGLAEHLPGVLARFLAAYPGLSVDVEERPSEEIADALRAGVCELGIASDAADLSSLHQRPLWPDPLVLVLPRGHAWAGRARVGLAEVAEQPLVGLAADSALQTHLAQQARRLGRRLDYRVRLRSFESVCRLVGEGAGLGIVPLAVARRCARSCGVLRVALADAFASRSLVLCWPVDAALAPAAQAFVQVLHDAAVLGKERREPDRRA